MAILTKRTSSKKLPAVNETQKAPSKSAAKTVGKSPAVSGGNPANITSKTVGSKPALTIRTPSTAVTKTTSPNLTSRPKVVTSQAGSNSSATKLINALTGAGMGVGSKMILDKFLSKPAIKQPKNPAQAAPPQKTVPSIPKLPSKEIQDALNIPKDLEEPITPPSGAIENDDGTYSVIDNGLKMTYDSFGNIVGTDSVEQDAEMDTSYADGQYFQDDSGNIYTMSADGSYDLYYAPDYVDSSDNIEDYSNYEDYNNYEDFYDYGHFNDYGYFDDYGAKQGGLITMMKNGGVAGYSDGGETMDYFGDDGSAYASYDDYFGGDDSAYASYDDSWPTGFIPNDDGTATQIFDDGSSITVDANMNPVSATEATEMTSSGGGLRTPTLGNYLTDAAKFLGLSDNAISNISGALPAAGAGALLASFLGSGSDGGGAQNQGLDMSKVGVINPRTTDFGIGPTRFVGYEDYGTSDGDYAPNEELLRNLNAPSFNPVNEGDYEQEQTPESAEAPKMASGGLSSMATPVASYYTFGQPADILANLGMRPQPPMNPPEMTPQIGQMQEPQQAQQQGLPQQAPPQQFQQQPQQMPQQGIMPQQQGMPPPMRNGGLPHVSNVPSVQGRMDFRQGSAVHGEGDGQSDDIPAMLADGEYVIDAETVAQIGNGSTKAGAQALDKFREGIRSHKRSAPINKIPPKTKALTSYLKG